MKYTLYFAYGSNLDRAQMRVRCPSARAESCGILVNHVLTFSGFSARWGGGVANVVRSRGARVNGVLYRVSKDDLEALDRFEGHPLAYRRVARFVTDEKGRRRLANVYVRPADDLEPRLPRPRYFGVLLRAYARLGFDLAPLAAAIGVRQ